MNNTMNRLKWLFLFIALPALFSCGIEEYYFLPQVPASFNKTSNTEATIEIPNSFLNSFYYAKGFKVFYRIYLSGYQTNSADITNLIHNQLVSDYRSLEPYIDPANNTSHPSSSTFRNFSELDYNFTTETGTYYFRFPTQRNEIPTITFTSSSGTVTVNNLRRFQLTDPNIDRHFINTNILNTADTINADVASGQYNSGHAYVAMYIVTVGMNFQNFSEIYSKPTFISLFKLPNAL